MNPIVNGSLLAAFFPTVTLLINLDLKFLNPMEKEVTSLKPSDDLGCYRSGDACHTPS
jgi:hypothetical protein